VRTAVETVHASCGPIAILVNNAGWDRLEPFTQNAPELWDRLIDINLKGPIYCTRAVVDDMIAAGAGKIINISSDAARVGSSGEAVYAACKGGVVSFSKTLARELALTPLVEVHDEAEVERALQIGARVIGVNNRDLRTFTTDIRTTARCARVLDDRRRTTDDGSAVVRRPSSVVLVSESGIFTPADVAAVAGTPQAQEAVIANSIPQTATVPRVNGPVFTPVFDGAPQLRPIEGTPLEYVINSPTPIIQVNSYTYYALRAGVWYWAAALNQPWTVAAYVAPVIYTIPPTSPLHYVTYVQVYGSTAQVVYVGYTPGYYSVPSIGDTWRMKE